MRNLRPKLITTMTSALLLAGLAISPIAMALQSAQQSQSTPRSNNAEQGEFSASFNNTDINEFIQTVSRNLELTIVVHPEVRGRINVRSYDVLNRQQYYQFFLDVLEVYSYAVVESDNGTLRVIRDRDARNTALPVVDADSGHSGAEMITRVVAVENVSVRELAPLLRGLNDQSGGGNVVSYDPSNVIMITGRAAVVNRLVEVIERVDQAGDQDVERVELKHASAAEMVRIAAAIFIPQSSGNTPELLVPRIVADERTNSVLVSGEPRVRARVVRLIKELDSELESTGNTRVFYLRYAKAEEMVEVLRGMTDTMLAEEERQSQSQGSGNGSQRSGGATQRRRTGDEVSIQSHDSTNALVVTAQPSMIRAIEDVVRQLDIRRAQVLVEAIIVEVFEGDGLNFGVQWLSEDFGLMQHNNGNLVPLGQIGVAAEAARTEPGTVTERIGNDGNLVTTREPDRRGDFSLAAQLLSQANGLLLGTVQDGWGAVLQAVSTNTNSNILSAPSITTLDNQEANFLVGQDVPTITGSTAGSNNENPFQTVDRREIGIRLRVTPQINEGDSVQMVIEQEVSSLAGATNVDITINKRELSTTVLARDGETIVLGGLIDEDVQESLSKVPILGDIPILGHLFKSTSVTTRKRNLMVFIRPTIIRDDIRMDELSSRKYSYIRAQQLEQRERGLSLRQDSRIPVLPEWDEHNFLPPGFEQYLEREEIEEEPPEREDEERARERRSDDALLDDGV